MIKRSDCRAGPGWPDLTGGLFVRNCRHGPGPSPLAQAALAWRWVLVGRCCRGPSRSRRACTTSAAYRPPGRRYLPLPEPASPEPAIGDVLALLMGGREAEANDGTLTASQE